MLTFTSKIYQEEEVRLRGLLPHQPVHFVPDFALEQATSTAIEDPNCQLSDAKNLLRQLLAKNKELETRLLDYEDTSD